MRLVPDHGEELVLTRKAFQVRDSWLAELKGTEADGPGWPARPLDHGWTLWITPEGVLSAPECGLPAGRNGRRETPNTTGSLASRVDRPARGTPDAFVDEIVLRPIWGNWIARKVARYVRFDRPPSSAFSVPCLPTSCFLLADFGNARRIREQRGRSMSTRTPTGFN
jgi:hypothetical protein